MAADGAGKRGSVIVISGPSGVGKSTVCHRLCEMIPAEFSVSVTTRKPRQTESNARDYHYVSREEFDALRDRGGLLEWAQVYGHFYGTPSEPVLKAIDAGRTIILEIDVQGCIQVRQRIPEARTFFLLPPSSDEQRRRIVERKTDPAEVIAERLSMADGEIRFAMESNCYDEFIVNDDLDASVRTIYGKITGAR